MTKAAISLLAFSALFFIFVNNLNSS